MSLQFTDHRHLLLGLRADDVGDREPDLDVDDFTGELNPHEHEVGDEADDEAQHHLTDDGGKQGSEIGKRRDYRHGVEQDERNQKCQPDPHEYRNLPRRKDGENEQHRGDADDDQQERFQLTLRDVEKV